MGNIDSRAKHDCGYLMLQTEKPFYEPGEVITGTIYIRCTLNVAAKHIMLEIKGKEKASWWDTEHRSHQRADGTTAHTQVRVKRKADKKIMEYKNSCFNFSGGLFPGDYAIPFKFQLPTGIPSSILYNDKKHNRLPKAKVKYHIKAVVETFDGHSAMKYKQILIVREKPPHFEQNISQISEHKITTWCCVNQGVSRIEVNFDKNTFFPNETCKCLAVIDNSKCNIAMKNIRLSIE